jgi:hypothetical protein
MRRRAVFRRLTVLLVGLALIGTGFVAGSEVEKSYGSAAPAAAVTGPAFGGQGLPSGGPSASPATSGTVVRVDGTTVYVRTASGALVAVKLDGSTAVDVTSSAAALAPGASVTVTGQTNSDGSVTASRISPAR